MVQFTINGANHEVTDDEDQPLLWYLREQAGLKGAKFGCGIGQCGACTVHVNGNAIRSCAIPVSALGGADIVTIEGLASGDDLHPVQQAWIDEDVPQCGYCQSGQIMAVVAFLKTTPNPTDADIDAAITNLCRCGTYSRIRKAIHRAAAE